MRILIVNPNTTEAVTSLMLDAGRASASPGVDVRAITAPRGLPYITSRAEAQIGGAIALEMLAEARGEYDAAIIAAFGDPGLFGARELFDTPVIGISEAAMLTACMLGGRFLIVTFASLLCGWFATASPCTDLRIAAPASLRWTGASARWRTFARRIGRNW